MAVFLFFCWVASRGLNPLKKLVINTQGIVRHTRMQRLTIPCSYCKIITDYSEPRECSLGKEL